MDNGYRASFVVGSLLTTTGSRMTGIIAVSGGEDLYRAFSLPDVPRPSMSSMPFNLRDVAWRTPCRAPKLENSSISTQMTKGCPTACAWDVPLHIPSDSLVRWEIAHELTITRDHTTLGGTFISAQKDREPRPSGIVVVNPSALR